MFSMRCVSPCPACAASLQLPPATMRPCFHCSCCALQASVAVRFCPKFFARSQPGEECRYPGQVELPYKMVFAIATFDAVALYSTEVCAGQSCSPDTWAVFACVQGHVICHLSFMGPRTYLPACSLHVHVGCSSLHHHGLLDEVSMRLKHAYNLHGVNLDCPVRSWCPQMLLQLKQQSGGFSHNIWLLQDFKPLGLLGNLHPAPITDLTWSHDGQFLVISSSDGYCRWSFCFLRSWPVSLVMQLLQPCKPHPSGLPNPCRLMFLACSSPVNLLGLMRLMDVMCGLCSIASFGSTELGEAATYVPLHIACLTAHGDDVSNPPLSSQLVGA